MRGESIKLLAIEKKQNLLLPRIGRGYGGEARSTGVSIDPCGQKPTMAQDSLD